jgi:DNA polymerase elongation subunit (family B)
MNPSTYLVFDVETYAKPISEQNPELIKAILPQEDEDKAEEEKKRLGLYALASEVACIAVFDPIHKRGACLINASLLPKETDRDSIKITDPTNLATDVATHIHTNERELLKNFWQIMEHYDLFVTFNGRGFDCPYLMQRSLIQNVSISKSLFSPRFNPVPHLDLCDLLSGFGASRRYNLNAWCLSMNIPSPKAGGIDGSQVGKAIEEGRLIDVTEYCLQDVIATSRLSDAVITRFNIYPYQKLIS